jgi:hypothetical protein
MLCSQSTSENEINIALGAEVWWSLIARESQPLIKTPIILVGEKRALALTLRIVTLFVSAVIRFGALMTRRAIVILR